MSIPVKFYTFSKRTNSTKVVTSTPTSYDCVLRERVSVSHPEIVLQTSSDPVAFNYAYIAAFNRYYFIDDWRTERGQWIASMSVDTLATYKSSITGGSHYVLRSASDFNTYIQDSMYPATTEAVYVKNEGKAGVGQPDPFKTGMCFVVGVMGTTDSSAQSAQLGSVSYYCLTNSQLWSLLNYMTADYSAYSQITEYSAAVQRALLNPLQYITSCHAMPIPEITDVSYYSNVSSIPFGPYRYTGIGTIKALKAGAYTRYETQFDIASHPQIARGKYLNSNPYRELSLSFGPFGEIPIDPVWFLEEDLMHVFTDFDFISGEATINIYSDSGEKKLTTTSKVSVELNIASVVSNPAKSLANMGQAFGALNSIISGGWNEAAAFGNAINDYMQSKFPIVTSHGSQGSFVGWNLPVQVCHTFMTMVDDDNTENGKPLCAVKTLSSLSGYAVCRNADAIVSGATHDEVNTINNYLNTGFYIE